MKQLFFLFLGVPLFLLCVFPCSATEYKTQEAEEKIAHPDLGFAVTFDNYSTHAELAKGSADSSLPQLNLGLRGTVGFDTQQGFQPIDDETLFYQAADNIQCESGTVSFWVNAPDYSPADKETDGKKGGNIALFEFMAKNSESHLHYYVYEFGEHIYFDLWLKGENSPIQLSASREKIRQKQWHQIVLTWSPDHVALYLNGECHKTSFVKEKIAGVMRDFRIDPAESYFGIPLTVWGEKRSYRVLFDDLLVYKRALSKLEVQKQYAELEKGEKAQKLHLFETTLHGIDKTTEQLDAEFDFVALPKKYASLLKEKKLHLEYTLSGPGGFSLNGNFVPEKLHDSLRFHGVDRIGQYTLQTRILDGSQKIEGSSASIVRPDLSFMGNKIGISDKVLSLWPPVELKGRSVLVWNRVYEFTEGPFPAAITVNGEQLLASPPELVLTLPSGKAQIAYTALGSSATEREAVLTGRGIFGDFSFDYTTVVAYDGMIKTNYVMHGSPQIDSMCLEWQLAQDSAQYLMTPLLYQGDNPEFSAPYPEVSWERPTMLWFTSEYHGGFAYAMVNDANWFYPEKYPVLKADTRTGKCTVTMIAENIKLPPETDYQVLFIATPTRPRAELKRTTQLSYAGQLDESRRFLFTSGQGLSDGISSYKHHPDAFQNEIYQYAPNSVVIYGMANSLTTSNPVGKYFWRDYQVPGAYEYTFNEKPWNSTTKAYDSNKVFSLSACNASSLNDYFLQNLYEMIHHSCGDRLWAIYYDLADNTLCGNERHGCAFTDKLGRKIKTLTFLKKRVLFERTLQIAHENGIMLFLHAQRDFIPFMHGLADYWYPGEQNNGLTMKNLNCYTDDIADAIWRSEYNSKVLGVNVIFLPASDTWRVPVAESMIAQCLLHDIDFSSGWMSYKVCKKVWMTLPSCGIDSETPFHRYDEQDKVLTSNPELKVSYYEVSKEKYLFILGNRTAETITAELDFSQLKFADALMRDEYRGEEFKLENGKLTIAVPARNFRMLGYPALNVLEALDFYPFYSNNQALNFWKEDRAVMRAYIDKKTGHSDSVSAAISVAPSNPTGAGGCYTINAPAVPGNTYKLKVWAKGSNLNTDSKVHLLFVAQEPDKSIGSGAELLEALSSEWTQYALSYTVPTTAPWHKTTKLQVTLFMKGLYDGTIWFDDIELLEEPVKEK